MSKQSKGLAGFGAVANDPKRNESTSSIHNSIEVENDTAVISNNEKNILENRPSTTNSLTDILDSVTNKPKQVKKRQISTYIDEDVAKKLDKFGKEHGKGAKSELINNFLKNALK